MVMRVVFFPHNEMQTLAQNIKSNNKRVAIGKRGEYDTQELLRKADILITDYSSVFFDFVYMQKPVICYQFDQEEFFTKHYQSSGKPYPFGDIFCDESSVISEIDNTIKRGCTVKNKYLRDSEQLYKYHDKHNCERVFELIIGKQP